MKLHQQCHGSIGPRIAAPRLAGPRMAGPGPLRRRLTLLALSTLLAGASSLPGHAAAADCPPYVRQVPGGDYNSPEDRRGLALVEFHFPPQVESLTKGVTGRLGGDIGYTLEHFPNHARALAAMAKLGLRDKSGQPLGARYTVICYFERAIGFVPEDARVRSVYGSYLLTLDQPDAALAQLAEAVRLDPDNATGHYNLGLLYLNRKDYPAALRHAHRAYGLGFPLPGLKNRLVAAGKWSPAPVPVEVPAPAPAVAPTTTPAPAAEPATSQATPGVPAPP